MINDFLIDITLIFQGKINNNLLEMLKLYNNKFSIIISYISDDEHKKIIKQIIQNPNYKNILIIEQNNDFLNKTIDNCQNIYYQCITVHNALKYVKTKYIFKIRSDEFFFDLTDIFYYIYNNNLYDKMICSDIFFRKSDFLLYHISDHFIFSNLKLILDSFLTLKLILEKKNKITNNIYFKKYIRYAEQKICLSILLTLNETPNYTQKNSNTLLKKNFEIFKATNFNDFNYSYSNKIISNYSYFNPKTDISNVYDIIL